MPPETSPRSCSGFLSRSRSIRIRTWDRSGRACPDGNREDWQGKLKHVPFCPPSICKVVGQVVNLRRVVNPPPEAAWQAAAGCQPAPRQNNKQKSTGNLGGVGWPKKALGRALLSSVFWRFFWEADSPL